MSKNDNKRGGDRPRVRGLADLSPDKASDKVAQMPAQAPVTPISDKLECITLSEQERGMLQALDANMGAAKLRLAEIQLQIMGLEQQRAVAAQSVVTAQQQLGELARGTATAHGIDTEDMTKRWHLDPVKGTITRTA